MLFSHYSFIKYFLNTCYGSGSSVNIGLEWDIVNRKRQPKILKINMGSTGKDPDAGKDWGQEEKGITEIKMVRWHHQLNEHEFDRLWGIVKDKEGCHAAVCWVAKSWT